MLHFFELLDLVHFFPGSPAETVIFTGKINGLPGRQKNLSG
jgi:hypothetical protein